MDKAPEGEVPALAGPAGESVGVVVDPAAVAGTLLTQMLTERILIISIRTYTVPVGETTGAARDEVVGVVLVRHDESLLAPTVIWHMC
jgi:hypothetical protein